MSRFKRSQATYVKQTHTITNWPAYDHALVTRGALTFWFTDEAISQWTAPPSGNAGGQRKYSNLAIETALACRMVCHLPWRQTKGCLQSLVELHGVTLEIPHHTTFSRRAKGLGKVAFHTPRHDRPIHILVDSTGVRVHSGNMRTPPKNRAELSPRTFCTFPRELSSPQGGPSQAADAQFLPRGVERCGRTADDHPHDEHGPAAATL